MATRAWLPTDLGADLVAWWDASDLASLASGAAVNSWKAKGGTAPVATAGGTAPTFNPTARNGKAGVLWANVASWFSWNGGLLDGAADVTVAVSAYMNAGASNGSTRPLVGFGTATGTVANNQTVDLAKLSTGFAGEQNIGTTATQWKDADHFLVVTKTGASGTAIVDGSDTVTNANAYGGNIAANEGNIGRNVATRSWGYWWGFIQQIVVVKRAVSIADRQRLEGWDSWYTGKNGANLPSGHPYKAAAPTVTTGGTVYPMSARGALEFRGSSGRLRAGVALHKPRGALGLAAATALRVAVALHSPRGALRLGERPTARAGVLVAMRGASGALRLGERPTARPSVLVPLHSPAGRMGLGATLGRLRAGVALHSPVGALGFGGTARQQASSALPLSNPRGYLGFRGEVGSFQRLRSLTRPRGALGFGALVRPHFTYGFTVAGRLGFAGSMGLSYGWSDLTAPGRDPATPWVDVATAGDDWQTLPPLPLA